MLERREVTRGLAGVALASATAPSLAATPPVFRKSPRLRKGDIVGLVEPAGFPDDPFDLRLVQETIVAMGLVPKPTAHLGDRYGYLAGDDRVRAADIDAMYADREVRAVFAVRGGWGCARILPLPRLRHHPRAPEAAGRLQRHHRAAHGVRRARRLHHHPRTQCFQRVEHAFLGCVSRSRIRRRDAVVRQSDGERRPASAAALADAAIVPGKAAGRLLGGNLTVLTALVGTGYLPDFTGAILFLEDTDGSTPMRGRYASSSPPFRS